MKKAFISGLIFFAAALYMSVAFAAGSDLIKVNIVMEDGTVMLYAGTNQGIQTGDNFKVIRNGSVVGHLVAVKVTKLFTYCQVVNGAVSEMDIVEKTEAGLNVGGTPIKSKSSKAPAADEGRSEETATTKPAVKPAKAKSKTPAEEESEEDISAEKKPVGRAKKEGSEPAETSGKKSSKTDVDKKEKSPAKTSKETGSKKGKADAGKKPVKEENKVPLPLGTPSPAAHGLSGILFVPTADAVPNGVAALSFYYANADDKNLLFKDLGYGITYGMGGNMELAAVRVTTDYTNPNIPAGYKTKSDSTILSFKYQLNNQGGAPGFLASSVEEIRYALGFNYYDTGTQETTTPATGDSNKVTRIFAVASGKYSMGLGHLGVYNQSGGILSNSNFKGLGIMAGVEYPFGMGKGSESSGMDFITEYDSKAFYIGTMNPVSIGLRYRMADTGNLSLSIADVSGANIMVLKGGYNF